MWQRTRCVRCEGWQGGVQHRGRLQPRRHRRRVAPRSAGLGGFQARTDGESWGLAQKRKAVGSPTEGREIRFKPTFVENALQDERAKVVGKCDAVWRG